MGPIGALAALALVHTRPPTIVVGATPGGSTDTLARVISQSMGTTLGRTVIVENKPGAGGNTLLMGFTRHTLYATLFKKRPFDPVADFTPSCSANWAICAR